MCSKILRLGLAAWLVTGIVSCGLRTGEKPPPPLSPSFKGENYSCVGQMPEKLDEYFRDRLSVPEIKSFVLCLQKAFSSFSQLTRGREEGLYSPEELRAFLQRNFLRERYVITDRLLSEFMLIKQVLVGGAVDQVTRGELYSIIEVLDELKNEAIRLKPHLNLINPALKGGDDPTNLADRLQKANEAMNLTIRTFATRLERSHQDYSLDHLGAFLTEFRRFVKWDEHFKTSLPVANWVELLKTFKLAAVDPLDPGLIHPDHWMPLLRGMWRWYGVFVHYQLGVKGQAVLEDVGLQNLILLADEVFDLSRDAIKRQPDLLLSFDTIMALVGAAIDLKWLPEGVRATSVRRAMQALTTRMFGDPRTPASDRRTAGLTMDALASMSADFYRWARIQTDLNQVYGRVYRAPRTPALQSHNYINPEIRQQLAGPRGSEWADFMHVNSLIDPLFPESTDGGMVRVVLAPSKARAKMGIINGFTNLSYMNLLRTAVTLIFRGYAEAGQGRSAWSTGIQSDELELFYQEFRDLGVDLKLVDWRNCAAGARSFSEGNLFTYTSDGVPPSGEGGLLDVREAMQLFAYLYSGGSLANEYYRKLAADGVCPHGPKDINGNDKLSRACVRERLPELLMTLDNLPGLRDYLRAATPEVRLSYVDALMDSVFTKKMLVEDPLKQHVEMNEMSSFVVVMHYAESIMTRFDKDLNGILSYEELRAAVPVFEGFIRKFMRDQIKVPGFMNLELLARGAFLFIVREGRLPSEDGLWDKTVDYGEVMHLGLRPGWSMGGSAAPADLTGEIAMDRLKLARAFGAIIKKLLEKGPVADPLTRQCLPETKSAG